MAYLSTTVSRWSRDYWRQIEILGVRAELGSIMIYVCTIVSRTYHTDFIKLSTKVSGKNLMLENCRLEVRSGGYFSRTILFNQAGAASRE